jgi:transposase
MLTVEEWMDVQALHRQGLSVRQIARLTGRSRNTVSRILGQPAPKAYSRPPGPSKLDPFKDYLAQRYQECPLSAVRLLAEIQPMGYAGSIDLVRRYLLTLKQHRALQAKATVRFETPPGHQGQMDWAFCGRFAAPSGELLSVYAFVMVLCFSRMLYLEFTTDMGIPTLLAAHLRAFAFFGGWPRELLYDNMKQVRLFAGPGGEWHPLFLDLAGHYGITPRVCRVRRPRTKGKVERSIGYVRALCSNAAYGVELGPGRSAAARVLPGSSRAAGECHWRALHAWPTGG